MNSVDCEQTGLWAEGIRRDGRFVERIGSIKRRPTVVLCNIFTKFVNFFFSFFYAQPTIHNIPLPQIIIINTWIIIIVNECFAFDHDASASCWVHATTYIVIVLVPFFLFSNYHVRVHIGIRATRKYIEFTERHNIITCTSIYECREIKMSILAPMMCMMCDRVKRVKY